MSTSSDVVPLPARVRRLHAELADQRRRLLVGLRIAILTYPYLGEQIDLIAAVVDDVLAHRRAGGENLFRPGGFWDRYAERVHNRAERAYDQAGDAQKDPDAYLAWAWITHARQLHNLAAGRHHDPRDRSWPVNDPAAGADPARHLDKR